MQLPQGVNTTACICRYHGEIGAHSTSNPHEALPTLSTLELVANVYTSSHGVLSLVVCVFGIPMNVLNITVLTRKHMRTPVNYILTWLAVFDMLTMMSYVPFSLHFYCLTSPWFISSQRNSYGWMTFLIFHVDFTTTTHTISIWLGVILAMFRYKHIFSPAKGHLTRVRRLIRARIAVFLVVAVSILVLIPNYLMNRLTPLHFNNSETNETDTIFVNEPLELGTPNVRPLVQVNLWLHSILAKLLPCILMVVYGGLLVKTLRTNIRMLVRNSAKTSESFCQTSSNNSPTRTEYAHEQLHPKLLTSGHEEAQSGQVENVCLHCRNQLQVQANHSSSSSCSTATTYLSTPSTSPPIALKHGCFSTTPLTGENRGRQPTRHQDNSRTTRMLLVVITLFLVTELPQGILIVLSATIPGFFTQVYIPLGDMMDFVALINNGINFLLYCIMSRDFRTTLLTMMKSTMTRASEMPSRVTTSFYRPNTAFDQNERLQTTLIVRSMDCSS